ncbi:MAG: putative tRNA sulfurtransferase [Candidatus Parcubacteria bacterium]|nr:MAG: putative tRNA sulfurtransferase [Candidatus Parcubacteria bacterium]
MFDYLLKSGELILKGKNRSFFEKILLSNLFYKLKKDNIDFIKNLGGVFWLRAKKDISNLLKDIIGINYFMPVLIFDNLSDLIAGLEKMLANYVDFYLEVKRGNKQYHLNSIEIKNEIIGNLKKTRNIVFNKASSNVFFIEYRSNKFFLGFQKYKCFGGLPVGSSGKGLALLSAGFDSPVASFLMMKRGLRLNFIHFHSYPQTSKDSLEKVEQLVTVLNQYNLRSSLFLMNILEIQKFYYQNIPLEFLIIFYRRTMMRLALRLMHDLKMNVLITGESLGQVASQTIDNLSVISQASSALVLRPLIGYNKQEIIDLAFKIGTGQISLIKGDDCCNLFTPRKVKTKAKINEVIKLENKIFSEIQSFEDKIYSLKTVKHF